MSEMKPVAWSYYKRYGFKWTLEFTETPLEKGLLRVAQITPLYTAAQLAEAVAAERGEHIQLLTDIEWLLDHGDDCETDREADIKRIQSSIADHLKAIRSAAK